MSKSTKSTAAEDLIESLLREVEQNGASGGGFSLDDHNPIEEAVESLPELDSSEAISLDVGESIPNVNPIKDGAVLPDEKTRLGHMPKMDASYANFDLSKIPDADRAEADILDIPDPDRQSPGVGGLLDIPDPDLKTSIRDMSDLQNKSSNKNDSPMSSEGATQALSYEVPRRPENTKTINLAQIPENPPHFDGPSGSKVESLELIMPESSVSMGNDAEKTIAVTAFANRNINQEKNEDVKVSIGRVRTSSKAGQVYTSSDATLLQAENLRIVQHRVLELENEIDHLRQENEELGSAAEIIKTRADELNSQMQVLVTQKSESEDSLRSEIMILKGNLQHRDQELQKGRIKIEELESRLKMDLKKIRVRERELENRLELSRAEKNAIVRSKDENILELKRKMDQMQNEIDSYRQKCLELNKLLESNHDSFKKTTRALRLALANLELSEEAKSQLKKVD